MTDDLDFLADLDREDLACAGLRLVSDNWLADLDHEARREAMRAAFAAPNGFKPPADLAPVKPRRQRKPSLRKMIAAAERDGRKVTSITTPDGVTLHFGKDESTEPNPWLDDLKVTKQ